MRAVATIGEAQGKRLAIPRCTSDTHLVFDRVRSGDLGALVPGRYNIPVAAVPDEVALDRTVLVLVPCLGVALSGHRVGSGRGFYDRALAATSCRTAVIAFAVQVGDVPVEAHDIAAEAVVTECGWKSGSPPTPRASVADRDRYGRRVRA